MRSQGPIGASLGAWILSICLTFALAQAPTSVKTWTFTLPHGTLQIDLQAYPDGTSSLSIGPDRHGNEALIAEQVEPLKQALKQMSDLGLNPRKLVYMDMRVFGEDVSKKLAYACADSKECRFNIQSPEREKVRVLIALLNQSEAFEPYNKAFKEHGIRVHVTEAEQVSLVPFSRVPPRDDRDRANHKMLVLGGAYVGMRFALIDATTNAE